MALITRILSQPTTTTIPRVSSSSFRHHRHRSNKSSHQSAQLIEIDLEPSSDNEVITVGIKKLEDAIHGMIVRRAAPDWLPFLPGYSYWVPPRRSSVMRQLPSSHAVLEVLGRFANNKNNNKTDNVNYYNGDDDFSGLSEDENLACSSPKGWPSSSFFTQGNSTHPVPVEMDMKFQDNDENAVGNTEEDEEG